MEESNKRGLLAATGAALDLLGALDLRKEVN